MDSHPLPGAGPPLPFGANAIRSHCRGEASSRPAQVSGLCPAFLRPPRLLGTQPPCVVTLVSSASSVSQAFVPWAVLQTALTVGPSRPPAACPHPHAHRCSPPPLRPDLPRRRPLLHPPLTTGPRALPGALTLHQARDTQTRVWIRGACTPEGLREGGAGLLSPLPQAWHSSWCREGSGKNP